MSLEFVWLIILLFFLLFSFLLYVVFLIYAGSRLNIYLFLWYLIWVYRTEGILVRIYICTWAVYIIIVLLFVLLCSLASSVPIFPRRESWAFNGDYSGVQGLSFRTCARNLPSAGFAILSAFQYLVPNSTGNLHTLGCFNTQYQTL